MPPEKKSAADGPPKLLQPSDAVPDALTVGQRAEKVLMDLRGMQLQLLELDNNFAANGSIPGSVIGLGEGHAPVTYEVERNRRVQALENIVAANADLMDVVNALVRAESERDAKAREALG